MKKLLLLLGMMVSLAAMNIVFAQTSSGVIEYEVKFNLHRALPPGREEIKAMLPEFRTSKEQLLFNENESLNKPIIEEEEDENQGGGIVMSFKQPSVEVYVNTNKNIRITKEDFFGKVYLIEDAADVPGWKFGSEKKTIAGYECQQAYYTDNSNPNKTQEVTAWYASKLRPFLGPNRYNTLPGGVLAVDINNGERVYVAKKVTFKELKKNDLKEPTRGEKISRADFTKIRDEQLKKLGGNGAMIIKN